MPTAISKDKINLSSENSTKDLANQIINKIKVGDIIFVYGEMGVGKTTFIKYLINAFQKKNNIKLSEVTSPTFNLLNEYEIDQVKINHYDLFRLKSVEEVKNLNLFGPMLIQNMMVEALMKLGHINESILFKNREQVWA